MEGYATKQNKAVEKACDAVNLARKKLREVLEREFPFGMAVRVTHSRGQFDGHVAGWEDHGAAVIVENDTTGKFKAWWYRHVEPIRAS